MIEAEMESMYFSATRIGESRQELDCRDNSLPESGNFDYTSPLETSFARLSRWFTRIFSPMQA
jgi:hypothetical protein